MLGGGGACNLEQNQPVAALWHPVFDFPVWRKIHRQPAIITKASKRIWISFIRPQRNIDYPPTSHPNHTFIKWCKCEHYVSCISKAILRLSGFLCSHKVCRLPGVCNTETNKQSKNLIRAKHEKSQEQSDSLFLANITFGKKRIREKFSWMDREDTH